MSRVRADALRNRQDTLEVEGLGFQTQPDSLG
jgi:hypothetical protein